MEIKFKYCQPVFVYLLSIGIFFFCIGIMTIFILLLTPLVKEIFSDWAGAIICSLMLLSVILFATVAFLITARITDSAGIAIFRETEAEFILSKRKVSIPYCVITGINYEKITGGDFLFLPAGKLKIVFSDDKKLTIHSSQWEAWKKKLEYGLLWKIRQGQYVPDVLLKQVCNELQRRTGICVFYSEIIDENTE